MLVGKSGVVPRQPVASGRNGRVLPLGLGCRWLFLCLELLFRGLSEQCGDRFAFAGTDVRPLRPENTGVPIAILCPRRGIFEGLGGLGAVKCCWHLLGNLPALRVDPTQQIQRIFVLPRLADLRKPVGLLPHCANSIPRPELFFQIDRHNDGRGSLALDHHRLVGLRELELD